MKSLRTQRRQDQISSTKGPVKSSSSYDDNHQVHAALVYVAIVGDLATSMHSKYSKMEYYEALIRERCERFREIKSSRIPRGSLHASYTSGALAQAVAHTYYVESARAVVHHLAGTHQVTHVTTEHPLCELLLDKVPYVKGDLPRKCWHEAIFALGGQLRKQEVEEYLSGPMERRRAMEGIIPIVVWRYVQGRCGVGSSYA